MPTSEEDLQAIREHNESLREAIAEETARGAELTASLQNDVNAAELAQETMRLEARLAEVKADNERLENTVPQSVQQAQQAMEDAVKAEQAAAEAEAARQAAEEQAAAEAAAAEQQRLAEEAAARAAADEENRKGGN